MMPLCQYKEQRFVSKFAIAVFFLATLAPNAAFASNAASACNSLSLGHVGVRDHMVDSNAVHFIIKGDVTNNGANQSSNTWQTVDIYKGPVKLDSESVPSLKAGQSFAFTYVSTRTEAAAAGTSTLRFVLNLKIGTLCKPSSPATVTF